MLLGRRGEQDALRRLLAAARAGQSGVVALVGEVGIGKSALLDALTADASDMRVLRARGVESEGAVPFGGLLELLRPALGMLDRIPAPQAKALESALALRPASAGDRFAVGAATLGLLAAYADEAPLLVVVDDAQWLDRSTADAVLFAVRRLIADPIAVVFAVRAGEPSLLDGADIATLRVDGLDRDNAGALLGDLSAETADRLFGATGGNPLALLELAGEELEAAPPEHPVPLPARIADAFLRRSAGLPAATRAALLLAATSTTGDLAALARAGLRVDDLVEAERSGLVRVAGGVVEFRHPLARSAVYGAAPPDERRAAHRALAASLPDHEADQRAWHLASAAAGADAAASAALEQAARRAHGRSAHAVASIAYERAARLQPADDVRGRLLAEAADAAWLDGDADRARSLLDEAEALDPQPRVQALRGLIATRRGPIADGHALLVAAAERAEPDEAVMMLAEASDACLYTGAVAAMLATAERAATLAGGRSGPAIAVLGAARMVAGADGAPELRRALDLFRADGFDDPGLLFWASIPPMFLRESDAGRELMANAIASARERTALGALPRLLNRLARDEAASDRWSDAEVDYHETIRLARETGQRTELAAALAGLAWLEGRQGREAVCREHAAEAHMLCVELGLGFLELWTHTALGELELGLGRPAAAVEHFEAREARAAELAFADVDMSAAPELVDAYLRLGRHDDAVGAATRYAERARQKGQPWALARAARCLGMTDDAFEERFEEALRLHAQTPDVFETARTQLAYGARLRRSRKRVRARELLRAAHDAFEGLGPTPWADAARAELEATGETARRRDPSTLGDLTAQELQIAMLLGGGKTTREAAAALFLSPKTVEYHLRSIYRKLGINSRDALARRVSSRTDASAHPPAAPSDTRA